MVPLLAVIDDFLPDPHAVRAHALTRSFMLNPSPLMPKRYAETDPAQAGRAVRSMARLVGRRAARQLLASNYLLQTARDQGASPLWVHSDRHIRVGLLNLNTPRQHHEATCFYRHRATGATRREDLEQLPVKWIERVMFEDSPHLDRWDLVARIENAWNRLILFDPRLFHQASGYFGRSVRSGRLAQTFVFGEVKDSPALRAKLARLSRPPQ